MNGTAYQTIVVDDVTPEKKQEPEGEDPPEYESGSEEDAVDIHNLGKRLNKKKKDRRLKKLLL